jgi:hypothetical protein
VAIRILYIFSLETNTRQGVKFGRVPHALLNVNILDMCRTFVHCEMEVPPIEEHLWISDLIRIAKSVQEPTDVFPKSTLPKFESLLCSRSVGIRIRLNINKMLLS